MNSIANNLETAKTVYNAHPSTCHRGDMKTVVSIVVYIVKIKPCAPFVKFIGFFFVTDFTCDNRIDAWRQRGFMNSSRLIEIKISPFFFNSIVFTHIEKSLKNVSLLNKATSENPVPGPVLIEW